MKTNLKKKEENLKLSKINLNSQILIRIIMMNMNYA